MKRLVFALAATIIAAMPAAAAEVKIGKIMISEPFARASAGQARNGAAFMTIMNSGPEDRLLAASSEVAGRVELHTHEVDAQGVGRMRRVEQIELPPGETVMLKPGGLHVMLMGLNAPLKEGESFPLTLRFENTGDVTFDVMIAGPGAMGGGTHHGKGMHKTN